MPRITTPLHLFRSSRSRAGLSFPSKASAQSKALCLSHNRAKRLCSFFLQKKERVRAQNAVQFMIVTAVILTVVGLVAITAGNEFEKTLTLAAAKNTANAFAIEKNIIIDKIETTTGNGHYNFTVKVKNSAPPQDTNSLKSRILEKIANVLNQPTPVIDANDCSTIAHFTYCVKINDV